MKKVYFAILLFFVITNAFAQTNNKVSNVYISDKGNQTYLSDRKTKGYFYSMQTNLLMGNRQINERNNRYYPSFQSMIGPDPFYSGAGYTRIQTNPSVMVTNGYMFNEHWAVGLGLGYEIYDHNLFPTFTDIRYTLWENKLSPYFAIKTGYAFGNFKKKRMSDLYLDYEPYYVNEADFRNYGGFMFNPEIGVKLPLTSNADLLFVLAYRHQKIKSLIRKELTTNQFDQWERKENLNKLSFGLAVMFR